MLYWPEKWECAFIGGRGDGCPYFNLNGNHNQCSFFECKYPNWQEMYEKNGVEIRSLEESFDSEELEAIVN